MSKIWNNQINSKHIVVWKSNATVDNDNIIITFEHSHILANLVKTTQ